jgi:hypothetical protein
MSTAARRSRRSALRSRAKSLTLAGVTMTTAAALAAGVSPPAEPVAAHNAEVRLAAASSPIQPWTPTVDCGTEAKPASCYGVPMFTSGPLLALLTPLLNLTGINPVANSLSRIAYDLMFRPNTTDSFYNSLNSDLAYGAVADNPGSATCGNNDTPQKYCRSAFTLTYGFGAMGAAKAISALESSAKGYTLSGYDPLTPAPDGTSSATTKIFGFYLNNVLTPNGGIVTRFMPSSLPGDPTMPGIGQFGDKVDMFNNSNTLNWAYNGLADFPVTANPLSLLNSMFATVPPPEVVNAVTGGAEIIDILGDLLNITAGTVFKPDYTPAYSLPSGEQCTSCVLPWYALAFGQNYLSTLTGTNADFPGTYGVMGANMSVPITYPFYIAAGLVNPLLSRINSPYLLGSPLADISTQALRILVNIGYDDVVTPAMLNTVDTNNPFGDTYAEEGYKAWDRTFYQTSQAATPFSWFKNPALTSADMKQAYSDAWTAFTDGLKAQAQKPLWGILVPNPAPTPGAASLPKPVSAAAQTVSVKPAAATAAPDIAPVSVPAPVVSEPAAPAPAPVSVPEPVNTKALTALADDTPAAPAAPARRGGQSASTGGGSSSDAGTTSAGHRGARTGS